MCRDASRFSGSYSTLVDRGALGVIKIEVEEKYDGLSKRVWDCCVLMLQMIAHNTNMLELGGAINHAEPGGAYAIDLRGRNVVEIGAGCGLLSMAVRGLELGGTVIATEYRDSITANLEAQVKRNGSGVKVRKFDWFVPEDVDGVMRGCDTVLMSDCTLTSADSDSIVKCMVDLVVKSYVCKFEGRRGRGGSNFHTDAIVGYCNERDGTASFLSSASTKFAMTSLECYHPSYGNCRGSIGKERYGVVHMRIKWEELESRVGHRADAAKFKEFYDGQLEGLSVKKIS